MLPTRLELAGASEPNVGPGGQNCQSILTSFLIYTTCILGDLGSSPGWAAIRPKGAAEGRRWRYRQAQAGLGNSVCAETSAFSLGMPRRWGAFAVLLVSPLTASNSKLGQSVSSTLEFRA